MAADYRRVFRPWANALVRALSWTMLLVVLTLAVTTTASAATFAHDERPTARVDTQEIYAVEAASPVVNGPQEAAAAEAASAHTYDATTVALVDVRQLVSGEIGLAQLGGMRDGSASCVNEVGSTSTTSVARSVATNSGGARFVAGSDGIVDTVGGSRNAISLGKYNQVPNYIDDAAATGSRAFSISDDAWNAMSPAEQVLRNERFLDDAIARGSEIRLASPPTRANLTGAYADEIAYLQGKGYTISSDGTHMIPPGG